MEQTKNTFAPATAADASVPPCAPVPNFADPPLVSPMIGEAFGEALAETFPPDGRKPRHDGWTPQAVAGFLRRLAETGVVDHAARAVGLSAQSAYALRNRRQGRAFARMWDAVLVHRARARIASELQARAVAGCVSVRKRDGIVVGEYHYYDNRLAMSLLTRLDRFAEREEPSEAHLRALSEDLDDFCDCLAEGGDADAFVESRKPSEPESGNAATSGRAPLPPDDDPELTRFALLSGCHHYRDVDPIDIDVRDLDPTRQPEWDDDQWVRAYRSGFMIWLEMRIDNGFVPGPGAPLRYLFARAASAAAVETGMPDEPMADEEAAAVDTSDLDSAQIGDWTDDQLARAWKSGLLQSLPDAFWDDLAAGEAVCGAEE